MWAGEVEGFEGCELLVDADEVVEVCGWCWWVCFVCGHGRGVLGCGVGNLEVVQHLKMVSFEVLKRLAQLENILET